MIDTRGGLTSGEWRGAARQWIGMWGGGTHICLPPLQLLLLPLPVLVKEEGDRMGGGGWRRGVVCARPVCNLFFCLCSSQGMGGTELGSHRQVRGGQHLTHPP